jgi:hypothetical protein
MPAHDPNPIDTGRVGQRTHVPQHRPSITGQ